MRKKYLSALLFGALLFASAGTFTSCKDYDDEIENLQGQIDAINTTIGELKDQIGAKGVSSVTFDEKTGVLTVVDGEGTKTYTIQTAAEAKVDAVIKDGKLYINDKEIGAVGGEAGDKVKVEDGKLYINEEVAYEFGNKVLLVKNTDEGTCTLTVGEDTVTLPLAAATGLVSLELNAGAITFGAATKEDAGVNDKPVFWGLASKDVKSQGVKGDITKGQFLVGQIEDTYAGTNETEAAVKVLPASFDLTAQSLTLKDSKGNVAPVYINAVSNTADDLITGSRAADAKGEYNLTIKFKDEVTKDNVADVFKSGGEHILYALFVNGVQYSDYSIAVKANAKAEAANTKVAYKPANLKNGEEQYSKLSIGETTLAYADPKLYDSYITFEGTYEAMARELGVEANGMTITAGEKAKGTNNLKATVHLISVTGEESTGLVTLNFNATTIDTPAEAETVTYKVDPTAKTKDFFLKVEGLFAGLSDEELEKVNKNSKITLSEPAGQDGFLVSNLGTLEFYKANKKDKFDASKDDLNELAYIKIADASYATDAKAGDYKLVLTIKDEATNANELVKINIPVKVTLPTFDELFTKIDDNFWTEAGRTERLSGNKKITLGGIFKSESVINPSSDLKVTSMKFTKADGTEVELAKSPVALSSTIDFSSAGLIAENKIVDKTLATTVTYTFGNATALKVESTFTVNLKSQFEDAALVWYSAKNTKGTVASVGANNIIAGNVGSVGAGLALQFNKDEKAMKAQNGILDGTTAISGLTLNANTASESSIKYALAVEDCDASVTSVVKDNAGIKLEGSLEKGQGGYLVVTFTDADGVETTAKIRFEK